MVADHKARPIAVGEHDDAPLLRHTAEHGGLVLILENTESLSWEDEGVHQLGQGVLVVAALDDDRLFDFQHSAHPLASRSISSVSTSS